MKENIPCVNIAILISGNGSNMENLVTKLHKKTLSQAIKENSLRIVKNTQHSFYYQQTQSMDAQNFVASTHTPTHYDVMEQPIIERNPMLKVVEIISNKPDVYGLTRAKNLQIESCVISSKDKSRTDFDKELADYLYKLQQFKDLHYVLLAGFMRILSKDFFDNISPLLRLLNIHPSFLPLHKGANGIEDSFYDTNDFGGVSIHYVDEMLDSGQIILQEKLPKIPNESLESFTQRIHNLEYRLYPQAFLKALIQDNDIINILQG